jgi:antitoxin component of MazEF toxin-antitoxin module
MNKKVIRVGTSAAITISPAELRELAISIGGEVTVAARAGVLEVRPVDPFEQASSEELLAIIEARRTRP